MSETSIPLAKIFTLFVALLLAGTILTLPLFGFQWHKLAKSSLFKKILLWIPIFAVFLVYLYVHSTWRWLILALLVAMSAREFWQVTFHRYRASYIIFFTLFSLSLLHLGLLQSSLPLQMVIVVITLGFATALSDVAAFFCGKYIGGHKLPAWLNNNKSWEGVFGQLAGAFIGVLLVKILVLDIPLWLFLPIGIGSAIGDLANSYVKRKLSIKDWSQAIPGHGGFIDRLSSLAGSILLLFYCLKIFGI